MMVFKQVRTAERGMRACPARCAVLVAGLGLAGALCVPVSALASTDTSDSEVDYTKEQAVYVSADAEGNTQGVYVVNAVTADEDGTVRDSGKYISVENLSDEQKIEKRSSKVIFDAQAEETFYYQGKLSADTELPWTVEVKYWLDGEEVQADELAGASGHLKMELTIEPTADADDDDEGESDDTEGSASDEDSTSEDSDDADLSDFSDAYLLQVSATLPADMVSELEAADATRAISGDDYQLSYMVFPGKSLSTVVEAEVTDFSFDGWQIVGVPLALSIDVDSSDISTDSMDGVSDLKDGAVELDDGANELADGASDLKGGADNLKDGASSLQDGVSQLSDGVDTLVSSGSSLVEASGQVDDSLGQLRDAAAQLNEAVSGLSDPGDGSVTTLQAYAQTLSAGLATLDTKYDDLNQAISDYTGGVSQLKDGVSSLSTGTDSLVEGTESLASGASDLKEGADELADGTAELRSQTADIDDKIADGVKDGLNDYLNPEFEARDFVSGETGHVTRVQFVIKTAAIEVDDDDDDEQEEDADEGEQSFIDKLTALFK